MEKLTDGSLMMLLNNLYYNPYSQVFGKVGKVKMVEDIFIIKIIDSIGLCTRSRSSDRSSILQIKLPSTITGSKTCFQILKSVLTSLHLSGFSCIAC
jgi:hypothetical protein